MAETAEKLRNITPAEEAFLEIDDLYDEAKNWADGSDIENAQQHDAASELYDKLHEAGKKADELRKAEKKPLDDQIKVIQDKFNPYIQPKKGKVDLGKFALGQVIAKWRDKERLRKEAEAEQARREAEEEARKAEDALRSSAGNLEAREEAERQVENAKIAADDAKRTAKAATTGNGLRTYYHPEVSDLSAAIKHYWAADRAAFEALVLELAEKDVRAGKREIPGINIIGEKRAI